MIQSKNLNKEIKGQLYLDDNIRSEEIDETKSEKEKMMIQKEIVINLIPII
jgi:hypothetical protein